MTLADKCTVYQPPSFKLEVFKFSWLSYKLFCVCAHTCVIRPEHFRWCSSGAATCLFLDRISSLARNSPVGQAGWPVSPKDFPMSVLSTGITSTSCWVLLHGPWGLNSGLHRFYWWQHSCSPASETASCCVTHSATSSCLNLPSG